MSRLPSLGPRGEGWLLLQLLLLLAIVAAAMAFPLPVDSSVQQTARVVGLVILVVGLIVFGLGIVTLGSSLSPLPAPMPSAELVERGIYRFIRHPIYTGLILAALGGCWWPIEVTPGWAQSIAMALPTGWTMAALHRLMSFQAGAAAALPYGIALAVAALAVGWIAVRTFRYA